MRCLLDCAIETFRRIGVLVALIVIFLAPGLSHSEGAISFTDGTFDDSDWTATFFAAPFGSGNSLQRLGDGNPGHYRHIDLQVGSGSISVAFGLRADATVDLGLIGGIESVEYSEDYRCRVTDGCFGQGQGHGVAIQQNGNLYVAGLPNSLVEDEWITVSTPIDMPFEVSDFFLQDLSSYPPWLDANSHPDFSPSGGIVQFGYFRVNSDPFSGYDLDASLDNWSVTVNPLLVVPTFELPGLLLLVALLGGVGLRRISG